MSQHPGSLISRYGCAFVSIAVAIWVRHLLDPMLGIQLPFATVFLAVLVGAWYGGFGPALAAVVLGALASAFFLMPPRGSLVLTGLDQQVGMAVYLFTGLGISLLAGSMHTARQRAESTTESLETRAGERTAELAQTNESLRASDERFRLLVEGVSDHAIVMLDPAGIILTWNSGAQRIDGYSADEIIGQHYSCLFTPESIADGKPKQELELAAGVLRLTLDVHRRSQLAGERFLVLPACNAPDAVGRRTAVTASLHQAAEPPKHLDPGRGERHAREQRDHWGAKHRRRERTHEPARRTTRTAAAALAIPRGAGPRSRRRGAPRTAGAGRGRVLGGPAAPAVHSRPAPRSVRALTCRC